MTVLAVLDVGGTSIATGAVSIGGSKGFDLTVGPTVPARAQESPDVVLSSLAGAAAAAWSLALAVGDAPILVVAVPGPFDLERGVPQMRGLSKFDSIYGVDLRHELRRRAEIDGPIHFVRDSEAVGVGEALHGAGRCGRRVLTVALGTGLGSCLTDAGRPVEHVDGVAVDQLHRRMTEHGRADDVLSARGLAAIAGVATHQLPSLDRRSPALAEFGRRLAALLGDVVSEWDVDTVVVAGGVSAAFESMAPQLAAVGVPVLPGALGVRAALVGAADLAMTTAA